MSALFPTPEQIANWHLFGTLLMGVLAVLLVTKWGLDRAIDWLCLREEDIPEEPAPVVVDFADRRRKRGGQ